VAQLQGPLLPAGDDGVAAGEARRSAPVQSLHESGRGQHEAYGRELDAAGDPDITAKLLKGHAAGGKTFKNHLDGYNLLPYLEGRESGSPRKQFFYFNDDGELVALRYGNLKFVYCEQRQPGLLAVWNEPFTCLRAPKMFNLRMDPYERADFDSNTYWDWAMRRSFYVVPTQDVVAGFLSTFKDYPPRQRPSSFSVDQIIEKFMNSTSPKGQ